MADGNVSGTSPVASAKADLHRSRREFLTRSGAAAVGTAVLGNLLVPTHVHAAGNDTLKIGLIGCGGRGSGAAANAVNADPGCRLVAMADAFADQLASASKILAEKLQEKFAVADD